MSELKTSIHPSHVLLPLGLGTALSLMGDATLYTVLPTHTAEAGIALSGVGIILASIGLCGFSSTGQPVWSMTVCHGGGRDRHRVDCKHRFDRVRPGDIGKRITCHSTNRHTVDQ